MANKLERKRVFVAPLDWGLGHAARILPLVRKLMADDQMVYIAATGRARYFFERELSNCHFIDFPRYNIRYSRTGFFVTRFMLITFPSMLLTMWREYRRLKYLQKQYKFDLIISDNRFCARHKDVPSLLISHQLRYKLPWPIHKMEWLPEYFNAYFFKKYTHIIVPDTNEPDSYTGELSHKMRYLQKNHIYYAGIINSFSTVKSKIGDPLNYLIIISGPEPQRTRFEKIIIAQINQLPGSVAVAMGLPEKKYKITIGDKVFYTYLNRDQMSVFMHRANFIIARPGYTTVMEMISLGKRGLLIPTPGQVEQEYLARFYEAQGWCHFVPQYKLKLKRDVLVAKGYPGFPASVTTSSENLRKLYKAILSGYLIKNPKSKI